MANELTNYITFDGENIETSNGKGGVSTLTFDHGIVAEVFNSQNDKAPTHRVFAFSPAGHKIEVGAIWKKKSQAGKEYFTIQLPELNFNANLGQYAGQDDPSVQAIIRWDHR